MSERTSDVARLDLSDFPRPVILVGGGRMGSALLTGWLGAGLAPGMVVVVDPVPSEELRAAAILRGFRLVDRFEPREDAVLVLAIKPQLLAGVASALPEGAARGCLVLSIMAGVTAGRLRRLLPDSAAIVRAMPNLPAAVGQGATVVVAEAETDTADRDLVDRLLASSGLVEWLDDEALVDAATALSGSGPGYLFRVTECLAEAGRRAGLPADVAARLARATMEGTGALMRGNEKDPAQLRADVTSPGGTTQAGLSALDEDGRLVDLFSEAVSRAANRARELAAS